MESHIRINPDGTADLVEYKLTTIGNFIDLVNDVEFEAKEHFLIDPTVMISVNSEKQIIAILVKLPCLPFTTYFQPEGTKAVPKFHPNHGILVSAQWTPPSPWELFFGITGLKPFVCLSDGTKAVIPPIPNLHTDGSLCSGTRVRGTNLSELAKQFTALMTSHYNLDLYDGPKKRLCEKWFCFSTEDDTQIIPEGSIETEFQQFSNPMICSMIKHQHGKVKLEPFRNFSNLQEACLEYLRSREEKSEQASGSNPENDGSDEAGDLLDGPAEIAEEVVE